MSKHGFLWTAIILMMVFLTSFVFYSIHNMQPYSAVDRLEDAYGHIKIKSEKQTVIGLLERHEFFLEPTAEKYVIAEEIIIAASDEDETAELRIMFFHQKVLGTRFKREPRAPFMQRIKEGG